MNEIDLPRLSSSVGYTGSSNYIGPSTFTTGANAHPQLWVGSLPPANHTINDWSKALIQNDVVERRLTLPATPKPEQKVAVKMATTTPATPALRIVRMYLVDPDQNLPLDRRVIHAGAEMTTDATDAELMHEVPVKEILAMHNEFRKTVRDKAVKSKEVYLEPVRMRDLILSVVTVASF
jgi:hypothetical protein